MTKKELLALLEEMKADQKQVKDEQLTKEDIKKMMAEFVKENQVEKKDEPKPENKKIPEIPKIEEKEEDEKKDLTFSKDVLEEFMKGLESTKKGSEKPVIKDTVVEARGGGKISLIKENNTNKGFGF